MRYVHYIYGEDMIASRFLPRGQDRWHYNVRTGTLRLRQGRFRFQKKRNRTAHLLAILVAGFEGKELMRYN